MSTTFVRRGARPGSKPRPIHSQQPQRSAEQFVDDYAMDRIDFRVRELTQRFHLDESEQEDYRQDMVVELLKARKRFDPARAARETFINRVLDRFVLQAVRTSCRRMRRPALSPLGFDDVHPGFEPCDNDIHEGELDEQGRLELRLDLEMVIARMPQRLQRACQMLSHMAPADAARALGINPRSIYRLIGEIRQHLEEAGLGPDEKQRDEIGSAADVEGARK